MPRKVTSTHPLYDKKLPLWTKVRDAIAGEEAVKAKGSTYLPLLDGQEKNFGEYLAYKRRASFFGGTERTVKGLTGTVLRKDSKVNWPEQRAALLKKLGKKGQPYREIEAKTLEENTGVGRYALLVDAPPEGENKDPFVVEYRAEAITDWDEADVDGRRQPILVTLREERLEFDDDGKKVPAVQYRVLRLGTPTMGNSEQLEDFFARLGVTQGDLESPIYFQDIWIPKKEEKGKAETTFMLDRTIVPRMFGGRVRNSIPLTVFNPDGTGLDPDKPPVLDLANVCYSIYLNSADLEHGRHFTALPTAWTAGFGTSKELKIGSGIAWMGETGATAGFLEFTGKGLGHLSEGIVEKKKEAAMLGARLLEEPRKGAETEGAIRLRQAGEQSVIARISITTSLGLTNVLQILAEWLGLDNPEEVASVELNTDFNLIGLTSDMLNSLFQIYIGGGMSYQTFFFNLERGEMTPDGVTVEEEVRRIAEGGPGIEPPHHIDDEPGLITVSEANGHRHTFRPGDRNTSEDHNHTHTITEVSEGVFELAPAINPERGDTEHNHTVPNQGGSGGEES